MIDSWKHIKKNSQYDNLASRKVQYSPNPFGLVNIVIALN